MRMERGGHDRASATMTARAAFTTYPECLRLSRLSLLRLRAARSPQRCRGTVPSARACGPEAPIATRRPFSGH
eukprot:6476475-Alexandrium_andersonii.AAC.1